MSGPHGPSPSRRPEAWIRRVRIQNFRGIAACDVELKPLTVLVGRNGSGKSNFVEALNTVAHALRQPFEQVFSPYGGFRACRYAGAADADTILLEVEVALPNDRVARYGFELEPAGDWGVRRVAEWLDVEGGTEKPFGFRIEADTLSHRYVGQSDKPVSQDHPDQSENLRILGDQLLTHRFHRIVDPQHLYLPTVWCGSEDRELKGALAGYTVYDPIPAMMRSPYAGDDDNVLQGDGHNLAAILQRLQHESSSLVSDRVLGFLQYIVPNLENIRVVPQPPYRFLNFSVGLDNQERELSALAMSDGTLRALACLVAVAQQPSHGPPLQVVAIEEPENTIHPAATAALVDAFDLATLDKQVVITTHSADLLDLLDIEHHQVLTVEMTERGTEIGPMDRASRQAILEKLYTLGELQRMDTISSDWHDIKRQRQAVAKPLREDVESTP